MKKKLTAIGNSLGIVIEKPILELLNIDRKVTLDMSTDGHRLIIEPLRPNRRKRLADAAKRVMDAHDKTLRALAE